MHQYPSKLANPGVEKLHIVSCSWKRTMTISQKWSLAGEGHSCHLQPQPALRVLSGASSDIQGCQVLRICAALAVTPRFPSRQVPRGLCILHLVLCRRCRTQDAAPEKSSPFPFTACSTSTITFPGWPGLHGDFSHIMKLQHNFHPLRLLTLRQCPTPQKA